MTTYLVDDAIDFEFDDETVVSELLAKGALIASDKDGNILEQDLAAAEGPDDTDEDEADDPDADDGDSEDDLFYVLNPAYTFSAADVKLILLNTST